MKKLVKLIVAGLMCLSLLSGCTNVKSTIAVTVYPVAYLINKITGNRLTVENISTDVYISRANLADNYDTVLQETGLLIYINGLEPYMDIYYEDIQQYSTDIIDLASLSAIDDFGRYSTASVNNSTVTTIKPYYDDKAFELVDTYDKDPYIWLDPIAMSSMASTIKDWLVSKYPENSKVFESNFKSLQADLIRLDDEYQQLNDIKNIKIVTVTPSFGNWQKSYGVEVYPLITSKYGVLPTASQLTIIEAAIKEAGVKYIVYDRTLPDDMQQLYEQVKTDLGLTAIEMSSLTRLSEEDVSQSKDYLTIMYENLTNLEAVFK